MVEWLIHSVNDTSPISPARRRLDLMLPTSLMVHTTLQGPGCLQKNRVIADMWPAKQTAVNIKFIRPHDPYRETHMGTYTRTLTIHNSVRAFNRLRERNRFCHEETFFHVFTVDRYAVVWQQLPVGLEVIQSLEPLQSAGNRSTSSSVRCVERWSVSWIRRFRLDPISVQHFWGLK